VKTVDLGGVQVSAVGLGTWQFGSREWGYGADYAEREAPAIVRRALELGVTFIDTAEMYGLGASERIIGRALAVDRAAGSTADGTTRSTPFLATKLMPILPIPGVARRSATNSRRRLRTGAIDLYQLHWPNPFVPLRTQARALATILDAGIARQAGVSNHSLAGWQAIERALARPIVSNQVNFSLVAPSAATELVPYARDHGRVIIAYSPLGQGLLARTDPGRPRDIRRFSRQYSAAGLRRTAALRAAVADIARAHGATPAQVALAWLIAHGNVIVIPGAHSVAQLEENAAASDLDLSDAELARLTALAGR
jgi:aryl-alcohol dehydrogenase-like predicted oxidoreductase